MNKIKIMSAALFLATVSQGETLAQWGAPGGKADIVSTQKVDGGQMATTFDSYSAVSPAVNADYYPNNIGHTPEFYGALSSGSRAQIFDKSSGDYINTTTVVEPGDSVQGMLVWKAQGGEVTSFSIEIGPRNPVATGKLYWLVEKEGQYYVSATSHEFTGRGFTDIADDAAALSWNMFTPLSGGKAVIGAPATISLSGVTAVGIYFDTANEGGKAAHTGAQICYFVVN